MRKILLTLSKLTLLTTQACKEPQTTESVDTIIFNGAFYTADSIQKNVTAVAIKDGKIVALGSTEDIQKMATEKTEKIDAKGNFVMPGIIEGHGHIHGLGSSLVSLNLMEAKSWDEIVAMVAEAAKKAKPGDWIIGRGWHQEKWNTAPQPNHMGYPYHESLDAVSPNNPVFLSHASGHSCYVNAKALELSGITDATANPSGGDIVKDGKKKIVGVLEETAQRLIYQAYETWENQRSEAERNASWAKMFDLAEGECLKNGITSFHDAGSNFQQVAWMKALADSGKLKVRHWVMVREGYTNLKTNKEAFKIKDAGNGKLTVQAVKVSLDGALGSYGAWLLEPYSDRKGWVGLNTFNIDSLKAIAAFCWENKLQLCVHAIGDKANRETINIFAEQIQKQPSSDHRWRVEHAQHVNPSEIPRFKQWNVIASMQSIHCTSDAPFVEKRLGKERAANGAYMWKAFLNAGVVVTNGTDVPVEKIDPFACIYAAVTRKQKNGEAFYPEQKMTREEALYSYTMANAYSSFQDKEKGSLSVGKYADIVILDKNLLTCDEEAIKSTKVIKTIVGGKTLYSNQ